MKQKFKFSNASIMRMKGVDSRLIDLIHRSLEKSPIDFGIPQYGGFRTLEDQKTLFNQTPKVTKADGVKIRSKHQDGKAIDVFAFVNGKASWDKEHLAIIAGVILSEANEMGLNITWGGTFGSNEFKGWDRPHFQIED